MLLIIDNQSSFIKSFKRNFLSEQNIESRFIDHNELLILTADYVALMNFDVPILGVCPGYEIIAVAYMGRI